MRLSVVIPALNEACSLSETLAAVGRVLAGQAPAGFQTPSRAYGADFIMEIEGVTREDLE